MICTHLCSRVNPVVDLSAQQWKFAFIVKCTKAEGLGVVTLDFDSKSHLSEFRSMEVM